RRRLAVWRIRMEERDYDQFTLKIHHDNTLLAEWITHDNIETSVPDSRLDDYKYLLEGIQKGISKLKKGELDGRADDIQRLGQDLFRAIFPDKVGNLFEQAIKN